MKTLAEYAEQFRPLADRMLGIPVGPQGGGILKSELLLFVGLCIDRGVTRVVESGRFWGHSTEILYQFKDSFETISIDRSRVPEAEQRLGRNCPGAVLLVGEAKTLVPRYVTPGCGLLLDGPKGEAAHELFRQVKDKVAFCAIHDVTRNKPWKTELKRLEPEAVFTNDAEWDDKFAYLDDDYFSLNSRNDMMAESFGLAVFPGGAW